MDTKGFLVFALLIVSVLGCQPEETFSAPPTPTTPPCQSPFESLESIRNNPPGDLPELPLIASLSCVEAGWTEDQLLESVGEPYERGRDTWTYWWIESESEGGPYFLAYVKKRDTAVVDITAHAGHRSACGMLLD